MFEQPYIHEVDKDYFVVRTSNTSKWYSGSDFYEAVNFCRMIEKCQFAIKDFAAMIETAEIRRVK